MTTLSSREIWPGFRVYGGLADRLPMAGCLYQADGHEGRI